MNRRGSLLFMLFSNRLSVAIGLSLVTASFALGAAASGNVGDTRTMIFTMDLDVILRYVVQPVMLILLAMLGWFIRNAYSSLQDGLRKINEKVDHLSTRISYLEGVNSITSKES